MIAAHRGDWLWAPENSLSGFRNCIEAGIDMLEIDVRFSSDGVPVVIHDDTLERTTNGKGRVDKHAFSELKKLKLQNTAGDYSDESIPTLEEVMRLAKDKILVYIDKVGDCFDQLRPIIVKTETLHQTVLVFESPISRISSLMGDAQGTLIHAPVVGEDISEAKAIVNNSLNGYRTKIVQVRAKELNQNISTSLSILKEHGVKLFTAATWPEQSMGHDDSVSRTHPEDGWGWLVKEGFEVIETNHPYELLNYLKKEGFRKEVGVNEHQHS